MARVRQVGHLQGTLDVLVGAYRLLLERGYDDIEVVVAGTDSPNSPGYLAGSSAKGCRDLPGVRFTGYVAEGHRCSPSSATRSPPSSHTAPLPDGPASSTRLVLAGTLPTLSPPIGDFAEITKERDSSGSTSSPETARSLAGRHRPAARRSGSTAGAGALQLRRRNRHPDLPGALLAPVAPRCSRRCRPMSECLVADRGQSPHWRRLGLGDRHVGRQRRQLSTQPAARSLVLTPAVISLSAA